MSVSATSPDLLRLFARVLRAHRSLPSRMRIVGDAYVREEFRKHKSAAASFLPSFLSEWSGYASQLESRSAGGSLGAALAPEQLAALSPEQKEQLRRLEEAAFASPVRDAVAAAAAARKSGRGGGSA